MAVAVVMDTTTYLPHDLLDHEGVHQVSLNLNRGPTTTRESDLSADLDVFYAELAATSDTPKTSNGPERKTAPPIRRPGGTGR